MLHRVIAVTEQCGDRFLYNGKWVYCVTYFRLLIMRGYTHYMLRLWGTGAVKIPKTIY